MRVVSVLSVWSLIAALLLGCGGMSAKSARQPAQSLNVTEFSGHWQLDRQASDDVRARLLPLFEKNERRWRRNAARIDEQIPRETDARPAVPPDEDVSTIRWLQGQRQKEVLVLLAMAMPATQLDIQATVGEFRISNNKGEGTRRFVPGESVSLFVAVGGFKVISAWKSTAFVVESRGEGENRIKILEEYRVVGADQLEERLEVAFPSVSRQVFHLKYRRG